jgi:hypothetical protein
MSRRSRSRRKSRRSSSGSGRMARAKVRSESEYQLPKEKCLEDSLLSRKEREFRRLAESTSPGKR